MEMNKHYTETPPQGDYDAIRTCLICGEEMLHWQWNDHLHYAHANGERWQYAVGGEHFEVCSQCAQIIIGNYEMAQTDWKHWFAKDSDTDLEYDLWQSFNYRNLPFRCVTCWERNH